MRARILMACGVFVAALHGAAAQDNIGVAALVQERVTGALAAQERVLARGDRLFRNESVTTGQGGALHVLFLDQTSLSLGPETTIVLDEFVYDPERSTGKLIATVGVGVTHFVTGILPKEGYEIRTPTASIGVRGTVFDLVVDRSGDTTVVLRSGEVTIQPRLPVPGANGVPEGVRLATPGLAVSIARDRLPTPPGPIPPGVVRFLSQLPSARIDLALGRAPNGLNRPPPLAQLGPVNKPPIPPRVLASALQHRPLLKLKCLNPPPNTTGNC